MNYVRPLYIVEESNALQFVRSFMEEHELTIKDIRYLELDRNPIRIREAKKEGKPYFQLKIEFLRISDLLNAAIYVACCNVEALRIIHWAAFRPKMEIQNKILEKESYKVSFYRKPE